MIKYYLGRREREAAESVEQRAAERATDGSREGRKGRAKEAAARGRQEEERLARQAEERERRLARQAEEREARLARQAEEREERAAERECKWLEIQEETKRYEVDL